MGNARASMGRTSNRYRLSRYFFLTYQSESGKPTGHGRPIMKQDKNEELQSRRSFFKNAAKAALPILGAIAIANVPIISRAAANNPMDCQTGCHGACSDGCTAACSRVCAGCTASCHAANCYHSCHNTCSTTCTGTCYRTCSGSCSSSSR